MMACRALEKTVPWYCNGGLRVIVQIEFVHAALHTVCNRTFLFAVWFQFSLLNMPFYGYDSVKQG